jgi:hypothetical protein
VKRRRATTRADIRERDSMSEKGLSTEEAVHRAILKCGGLPATELVAYIEREYGVKVNPAYLPVFRASLLAKEQSERMREKARGGTGSSG